jgi:hypothetical protein
MRKTDEKDNNPAVPWAKRASERPTSPGAQPFGARKPLSFTSKEPNHATRQYNQPRSPAHRPRPRGTGLDLAALASLSDEQLLTELKKARDVQDAARASERLAEISLRGVEAAAQAVAAAEEKNAEARTARVGRDPSVVEKKLSLAASKDSLDAAATDADILTFAVKLRYRGARYE